VTLRVAAVGRLRRFSSRPATVVWFTTTAGIGEQTADRREVCVMMRGFLRAFAAVVLAAGLWSVAETASGTTARAEAVEYLMVPSAAMGRAIPVAFQGGGPHAVFLLDAFNAAPDVSNWVTAGNAMNTLAGKGISVAAPAGGAWSLYTNWEQDGSRQWETFLSSELPDWLAANKGLAQHVGPATAGPLEVARPGRPRPAAGEQQHPAMGVQPRHGHVRGPGCDDRLLRSGAGQ